jgi:hypothetical protein
MGASLLSARRLVPMTKTLAAPLTLALLTLLFMMPFLRSPTGNEVLDGHDLTDQQYPLYSFIFDSVREGRGLPLWNPYLFAGQSIAANPQATLVYPPAWVMALVGVPRGVGWLVMLHLWLGGWGMAVFCGQLDASRVGALVGGIIYAFSGLMAAHLEAGHLNYLMCAAWLPWIAAAYLWSARRHSPLAALPGAGALGLCILSGHPPMLYFGLLWLGVLWLYLVTQPHPEALHIRLLNATRPLLMIIVIGGLLGAALLLPTAEFTLRSTRTGEATLGFSNSYALPAGQLLTLLIPNLFGQPKLADLGYWGVPFYEELTAYVGILPLVAAFLTRKRQAAALLAAFVAIGLIVSIGIDGGLFPFLYYLLPGYSLFRVPSRALYFVVVGAAGLTALFITDLQNTSPDERREWLRSALRWTLPALATLLMTGSFALFAFFSLHHADDNPPYVIAYTAQVTALAALFVGGAWLALRLWAGQSGNSRAYGALAATAALVIIDLWHISAPLVTVSAVDVPDLWKTMAQVAPPSPDFRVMTLPNEITWQAGASYTHHLNVSGYDPLVSSDYQRLLDASGYNPTSPIARLLGVRYAISPKPFEWSGLPGGDKLSLFRQDPNWFIYEVQDPLPRVFITPETRRMSDDDARTALANGTLNPLQIATVPQSVECSGGSGTALVTSYTPNQVAVSVDAPQGGMLVLTDSYDPSWTATVDGKAAQLLRVDTALRGVCLPAGSKTVHFEYQPRAFFTGAILSVVSWAAMGIIGLFIGVRRWRKSKFMV